MYTNVKSKFEVSAEHLPKGCKHFSQSIMVSVAVSKLGKTDLVFVQPRAKINSVYYCDHLLEQGLLPDIRLLVSAGQNIVAYLCSHVPEFTEPENWPPNSPDLNPVDYSVWVALKQIVHPSQNFRH